VISAVAFLIFCAICLVLAFARHPVWALYLYLATTFVYPPGRWWGYMFGETRWSLLAATVAVLAIALHRGKLAAKPVWVTNVPAIVIVLYALWMWIQSIWALDLTQHLSGSTQISKYIVAFWIVYRIADTKERVSDILFAIVLGCALLGIFAHMEGRTGDRLDGVGGPGINDANTLGMYFAVAAIIGAGLLLCLRGWRRWIILACTATILNGLILTNTRGALLGLVAGGVVFALLVSKRHRRLFLAISFIGLLGLATIIDKAFIDRMWTISAASVQTEAIDTSAETRFVLFQAQLRMFGAYPMGSGHRGTEVLSPQYLDEKWLSRSTDGGAGARSSHNTFLTTLVEQGVPGALLFVWITVWTLFAMRRLRKLDALHGHANLTTLGASTIGALAGIFTAGNTADFLLAEVQFWLFALLVSILLFASIDNGKDRDGMAIK
jgi:O-antigen ligase